MATEAANRADEFFAMADIAGMREWIRNMRAIEQLQRPRAPRKAVH